MARDSKQQMTEHAIQWMACTKVQRATLYLYSGTITMLCEDFMTLKKVFLMKSMPPNIAVAFSSEDTEDKLVTVTECSKLVLS